MKGAPDMRGKACLDSAAAARYALHMSTPSRPPLRRWFFPSLGLLLLLLPLGPAVARADSALTCDALPPLMSTFLQHHVQYHSLDDTLKGRVVESYVQRLDPSRTLLLQKDADRLTSQLRSDLDQILQGDCHSLGEVHQDLVKRAREMEIYVRSAVGKPDYTIDPNVELMIDPAKRGFPKTLEERDALYHALIDFQISNYVSTGLSQEEAKEQLIHRYSLLSKQLAEQKADDLNATFLDAFATALDPHSNYFSPDDAEDFQISMGLQLEGIGLALSSRDGYSVVEEVIPGGAADRHKGVKPKDKIIAVGQEGQDPVNIIDMKLRDVVRLIRGKKGTPVQLTILRQSGEGTERFNVTIVRDKIDLEQQAAKLRIETREVDGRKLKLAILELPSFYGDRDSSKRQSERDVEKLLKQVSTEKADGLLLDLSRNGGGLLESAVSISGYFIKDGGIVAVQQGKKEPKVLEDPDDGILYSGPVVVLTSRITASASEILAGALKDYHRAVIVGDDQTFGKGTVQSVVPLRTGLGALKITTALFFRPAGDSTQQEGVPSDVSMPSITNSPEFGEGSQPYALPGQSISPFLDGKVLKDAPWLPVTPDVVSTLAEKSHARVAAAKDFIEVEKQLAEAKKNQGMVHLADILKAKDGGNKDPDLAARDAQHEPSPQLKEAVKILADYVVLDQERAVAQAHSSAQQN